MGNPVRQDFNAATATPGAQTPVSLDYLPLTSATVAVAVSSGTATFSVEITLDDINDPSVTPNWFTLEDFPVGSSVSGYGEIYTPWRFVRINIDSITGTLAFYVSQSLETFG